MSTKVMPCRTGATVQPLVATILPSPTSLIRVRAALRSYTILSFHKVADLVTAAGDHVLALVVVEPWDAEGTALAPTVKWFKSAFPALPIIVYSDQSPRAQHETVRLARAGIDALVIRGIDDLPSALHAAIDEAQRGSVYAEVANVIRPLVRADVAAFVDYC